MKSKTFKFPDSGAYITAYKRKGESWNFDLNYFEGDKSIREIKQLRILMDEAISFVVNSGTKCGNCNGSGYGTWRNEEDYTLCESCDGTGK